MDSNEFNQLRRMLSYEVNIAKAFMEEKTNDSTSYPDARKRIYIRSVFAFFEGYLYAFKQISERLSKNPSCGVEISEKESLKLRDKVKRNGEEVTTYLNSAENLKCAFKAMVKQQKIDFKIDFGKGWNAYIKAISIRNRITHPKSFREITITEDEMECIKTAHEWFMSQLGGLEKAITYSRS